GEVMEREREFAVVYESFAKEFPKLKIIMEHISTIELVQLLDKYDNLYATVTLHHLLYTLDDVIGGGLNPHNFCKPIIKTKRDREAIEKLVLSGNKKVFFGSDSAPHLKENKEKSGGAAGIYSAPVLLERLTEFFVDKKKSDLMEDFFHNNSMAVYNLELPNKTINIIEDNSVVPDEIDGIVPFLAGENLKYKIS
ncbi:MAG: amidohydrolase family protein, partial [Campylobacterales bacterium]|nr:amidohydrolase family protein [Campylobacterales bacterium]